ncbi:hypothetical protein [Haloferax denitrificans]|uniref:hypothetical protein n=1 Tax=Haloferax denitrificans TaxID=35745 RepID=UPI003C6F9D82
MMAEILSVPSGDDQHIEAKRHAVAALEGIDRAEKALRLWRDCEEGSVDLLDDTNSESDNDPTTPAEMREKCSTQRWAMDDDRR